MRALQSLNREGRVVSVSLNRGSQANVTDEPPFSAKRFLVGAANAHMQVQLERVA